MRRLPDGDGLRDCPCLLLRGEQLSVVCNARGIGNMRIPRDWHSTFNEGRFLVPSPFLATAQRPAPEFATQRRIDLMAGLAKRVFTAHAETGSEAKARLPQVRCIVQISADAERSG